MQRALSTKMVRYYLLAFILSVVIAVALATSTAQAASLYLSPGSTAKQIGEQIVVRVLVNSSEQAMNAAEGVIEYQPEELSLVSIDTSRSIFDLWVKKPQDRGGQINFSGIVLSPGWQGRGGELFRLVFKTKTAIKGEIRFAKGAVLANDGKGTNITKQLSGVVFVVSPEVKSSPVQATSAVSPGAPDAPQVSSPTHPVPGRWYNDNSPVFQWDLPEGVIGVSVKIDRLPVSDPGPISDGLIRTVSYKDLDDGKWYFHIKFKNSKGWGAVSHFAIYIDTSKPELNVEEIPRSNLSVPRVPFTITAQDDMSGVDYLLVQIDTAAKVKLANLSEYTTPPLKPGRHFLIVQAFDQAGNYDSDVVEFEIDPIEVEFEVALPDQIRAREPIVVSGTTSPNHNVTMWIASGEFVESVQNSRSDNNGYFTIALPEGLPVGIYEVWFEARSSQGAWSNPSAKYTIAVKEKNWWSNWNSLISLLSLLVSIFTLLIITLFVIRTKQVRHSKASQLLSKNIKESNFNLHHAWLMLRQDLLDYFAWVEQLLNQDEITDRDRERLLKLKQDLLKLLREIDKDIEYEIDNIAKQAKNK